MKIVPIDSIQIAPSRQRQDFDPEALTDLANSIAARGLMHPVVVRDTPTGLVLVAGERRLRALGTLTLLGQTTRCGGAEIGPGYCPVNTLGELSPLEAEEAELDENLKRRDLTWQEQAAAVSRLHALRVAQATARGEQHTVGDTTRELLPTETMGKDDAALGRYRSDVRRDITLAGHLDKPEVAKAKTPKDAYKALQRIEASIQNAALAERVGRTYSSSIHELYNTDCLEWLSTCPDGTFDVILTDPPYGMDAQEFGDGAGVLSNAEHHYDDSYSSWVALMARFAAEAYRVAKPQAHAYIFCDFDRFHELKQVMQDAGWYVFRTPIVNYKPKSGRIPLPEHGPRRQYEIALYAIKGKRPVTAIYSDVITTVLEENLTHGAQKPVELYVDLLRRSVRPGDTVLDAFAGTGTIFPAANQLKCKAVGIEQSPEYFGICVKRLEELDSEPNLI